MLVEFDTDQNNAVILARLATVLDPELDASIVELGFVHALRVHDRQAHVTLELPTSWCAMNFAFLMAEDVRKALLALDGIEAVTVRLGDHCVAAEIEAAVNDGESFSAAFPSESGGSLASLRDTFLRKGFLVRQERLLHELRKSGRSPDEVSVLCVSDGLREPGGEMVHRYLERRAELGLDCSPAAPLVVDQSGASVPAERLDAYYHQIRTVRVSMEANGSFCRALQAKRAASNQLATTTNRGNAHVQA